MTFSEFLKCSGYQSFHRKYSHGLPEKLSTSKGGRLDLVTIESILAVSFVTIVSVVLAREDIPSGCLDWMVTLPLQTKAQLDSNLTL